MSEQGTIKWFNDAKGYGFVSRQDAPDAFLHYTALDGPGFRSVKEGDLVEFEIEHGVKGPNATNVRVVQ